MMRQATEQEASRGGVEGTVWSWTSAWVNFCGRGEFHRSRRPELAAGSHLHDHIPTVTKIGS